MELTETLRKILLDHYRLNVSNVAFLVWRNPYDPNDIKIEGVRWKGKAYEKRQELTEDGIKLEDILIADIVDLNII